MLIRRSLHPVIRLIQCNAGRLDRRKILQLASTKPCDALMLPQIHKRNFGFSQTCLKKKNILTDEIPVIQKVGDVKVLLLDEFGNSLGTSSKRFAQDKADQMGLRMVNVKEYPDLEKAIGRTSVYPIYKMMKGEDLHVLQMGEKEAKKHLKKTNSKVLQLTSTAADHDIETKLKTAKSWLEHGSNVRVLILGRKDRLARMNELHQLVLSKLRSLARPAIADLGKTDTKIMFTLHALAESTEHEDVPIAPIHTKTEDHSAPLHEATKEFSVPPEPDPYLLINVDEEDAKKPAADVARS